VTTQRRKRGVLPTPAGLQKLRRAILEVERSEGPASRLTQEEISLQTGLAPRTLRKVFNREGAVSLSTLNTLFSAFALTLQGEDYERPGLGTRQGEGGEEIRRQGDPKTERKEIGRVENKREEGKVESGENGAVAPSPTPYSLPPTPYPPSRRADWGEALDVSCFYGYGQERLRLQQWLLAEQCRLVALLGLGGVGKTALATKVAGELQSHFDCVIWRSLRHRPALEELLTDWLQILQPSSGMVANTRALLDCLRSQRCLLILDSVESILEPGVCVGPYRQGYSAYGELFTLLGTTAHQSCLLLTSREKPVEVATLEGQGVKIRTLMLQGCSEAALQVLQAEALNAKPDQLHQLCECYGHSPLALKLVAGAIQEIFGGEVSPFLAQETTVFSRLRQLLDQQLQRISPLELTILYWLAIHRCGASVAELTAVILTVSDPELLEAIESLTRRALIEQQGTGLSLRPVLMEYLTTRLVNQVVDELVQGILDCSEQLPLVVTHALLTPQAIDQVRESQHCHILTAVAQQLLLRLGTVGLVRSQLRYILEQARTLLASQAPALASANYLAGNLINLLVQLQTDLSGYDFSGLPVWQADFRGVPLKQVNFQGADLSRSVFADAHSVVYAVAIDPAGELLATGHADGMVKVWRLRTGQLRFAQPGHGSSVWAVAFSPDGQILASGGFDATIQLRSAATGQMIKTLEGHRDWVRTLAFSATGRLASGGSDHSVYLWDIPSGHGLRLGGHRDTVTDLSFSPDGSQLASSSDDGSLQLWNSETGQPIKILVQLANAISSLAWHPDGKTIVSLSDQAADLWQVDNGHCLGRLPIALNSAWRVAFSPEGDWLAMAEWQGIQFWNLHTQVCSSWQGRGQGQVWALAFTPQGDRLVVSDNQQMVLWDLPSQQVIRTWGDHPLAIASVRSLAFSPTGEYLASGSQDQGVRVWAVATGHCLATWQGHRTAVTALAFSPQGDRLASGDSEGQLRLWYLPTDDDSWGQQAGGQSLIATRGQPIQTLAFSPQGNWLASGGDAPQITVWDLQADCPYLSLTGHRDRILTLAISPESQILASASADRTVRLWDLTNGECLRCYTDHPGLVWSIAFSPDGRWFATGSEDRTLRLWDRRTGDCLQILQGHQRLIWSVVFSPDSQTLLSGSLDQTVRWWDLQTGQCQSMLEGTTNLLWSLAFDPQHHPLAASCHDTELYLWNISQNTLTQTLKTEQPYQGLRLSDVKGLPASVKGHLKTLGARE
jgi:WD40 repeat protein